MPRPGVLRWSLAISLVLIGAIACRRVREGAPPPRDPAASTRGAEASVPLRAPPDSLIPDGVLGASIRRGHALLAATRDSLPDYVGNRLRCMSCHLDDGRRAYALPLVGVYARYPQYRSRNARVNSIEDRINGCFQRSMNGRPLPLEGRDIRDITAYLAWISRGIPVGATVEGQGTQTLTPLRPDTTQGRMVFAANCARCHGTRGEGTVVAPPLWGPESFNIGAGMARLRTAAAFIRHNMPYDRPGSLTDQQAFDVASYVVSRPRPDFAGKENDWPNGDAPPDVAYPTRGARTLTHPDARHP
ncbi:MAG TPA: c-type cytochrome [Gemmatimonadaceae bacterium]|nr:c-type cytochrome [Gemmatimonadaceae bacterium]